MSHTEHANKAIHQFLSFRHSFILSRSAISTVGGTVGWTCFPRDGRAVKDCATNIQEVNIANIEEREKDTDPRVIRMEQTDNANDCNLRMSDKRSNKHVAPTGITNNASIDQRVVILGKLYFRTKSYVNFSLLVKFEIARTMEK